jgi:hypothetical protein
MAIRSRKLLFVLILIGLLTGGTGCADSFGPRSTIDSDASDANHVEPHGGGGTGGGSGAAGTSNTGGTGGISGAGGSTGTAHTSGTGGVSGTSGSGGVTTGGIGGVGGSGGVATGGSGGVGGTEPTAGSGGSTLPLSPCQVGGMSTSAPVSSPPSGVEATLSAICSSNSDPVNSLAAGRTVLTLAVASMNQATGQIDVPQDLQPLIVGTPSVTVVDNCYDVAKQAVVGDIKKNDRGYSFSVSWSETLDRWCSPVFTVTARLEMRCDNNQTKTVESVTYVNLCDGPDGFRFVSSGDQCTVCVEICEMVASPIVPRIRPDSLPLPQAFTAEIVPAAMLGRTVALFAEHRGGRGPLSYTWKVSGGTLSKKDTSDVLWELPQEPGPHLIQVAIRDRDSAAVAVLHIKHTASLFTLL